MSKYNPTAWEFRKLEDVYNGVGWTVNRLHTVGVLLALNPASLLDIGCLDGATINRLRQQGYCGRYLGVDITKRHVELSKSLNPLETFQVDDARALGLAAGTYETVLLSDVIQHLDEPATAVQEACRVAQRTVLLSTYGTPVKGFRIDAPDFINRYSTPTEMRALIPAHYREVMFADLPHPTRTLDDKQYRIYHLLLQRRTEK